MKAIELISDIVPFLKTTDLGIDALKWMEIFRISHLPIVNDTEFLGLISDADIYDMNMAHEVIGNHTLSMHKPFVFDYQHIYEVIEVVSRLKLTVIPVLDIQNRYQGLITLHDLIQHFGKLVSVHNPGGIIVLELNFNDYSLSEIANIVEGNNAKILSSYITSPEQSSKLEVTLKLNKIDLTSILQTFNRFNYNVKASYEYENKEEVVNKERFEEFLNYLSI